jgi:hypothetical protein
VIFTHIKRGMDGGCGEQMNGEQMKGDPINGEQNGEQNGETRYQRYTKPQLLT